MTSQTSNYTLLTLAEGFGGVAVIVFFIARFLTGVLEVRMMESELIQSFYQRERPLGKFYDSKARPDPPQLPKTAPKIKLKHGVKPVNDDSAASTLQKKWETTFNIGERIAKLVQKVTTSNTITEDEVKTVQQVILNRENL